MSLSASRWHPISESEFAWEREALDWLRAQLPDRDPVHVWTNFEFIDQEGRVAEVDALVLTPFGMFLMEIKSRPGELTGDAHTWTWKTDGRSLTVDNPLLLTTRKAKRLSALLKSQPAIAKAKIKMPFVEAVVFLSSTTLNCKLEGRARSGTLLRGRPQAPDDDGIISALLNGTGQRPSQQIDAHYVRPLARALSEAGIRQSNKHRQVGDYRLGKLLAEGEGFQDFAAQHVSIESVYRRIRIYTVASATSPEARAAQVRQARREFEVLEGIDHPGILRCKDYKESELGPALIFEDDPKAVPLDLRLRDRSRPLTIDQQLQLVRDLAEILKFAHSKRLYHRALTPQSVLVREHPSGQLSVQVMNWQTAARNADTAATTSLHWTTGTRHVEDYLDDQGRIYLAPETARADPSLGPSLDVFSLGCIAYHVFSGQPPASSAIELLEKIRAGQGLRLSEALDNCGAHQDDLIRYATAPDLVTRLEDMRSFLDELDAVEDELTTPEPEATVDPSFAKPTERLEGGFTVIKRLGRGSTADALLVREDGEDQDELVLKVAVDVALNERLASEAEVLSRLRHPNIVAWRRTLTVAGRTAILMKRAGPNTLAERLRAHGRLSLEMLQRFGEQLIEAVRYLESEGSIHRDLKPDNIGVAEDRTGRLQLVVFDFSLARTPAENLTAGTPPYLDPFLPNRKPARWDLYAERFAAAMTLYEMAVGQLPIWGDGKASPAALEVEVTVEREAFDPMVREGLAEFFLKALSRDHRQRHDNAEEMLRAWRAIYEEAAADPLTGKESESTLAAVAMAATPQTTMAELGYSTEAQEQLERMDIRCVRDLLSVDRVKFRLLRGVGNRVRLEITRTAQELARRRPDLTRERATAFAEAETEGDDKEKAAVAINEVAALILPKRPASDDRAADRALAQFMGLDEGVAPGTWPALGEASATHQVPLAELTSTLLKSRERWLKTPAFTEIREQLQVLLASQGGVMTAAECASSFLQLRGCAEQEEGRRTRLAFAVLRAALEAEAHLDRPRFAAFLQGPTPLVATDEALADYACRLGAVADTCAQEDPLPSPQRALRLLEETPRPVSHDDQAGAGGPGSFVPLSSARLLRLATSASRGAALSSRQEIYPRAMRPLQALRLSIGALLGAQSLSERQVRERVMGRYPSALPLPRRPELDRLMLEAGAPHRWNPAAADGAGAYALDTLPAVQGAGTTTQYSRHATRLSGSRPGEPEVSAEQAQALAAETRLATSLERGELLVLAAPPRLLRHAEAEILRRFGEGARQPPLRRLSADALMLREMQQQAAAARVKWDVVLQADGASRESQDWQKLLRLVQRVVPTVRQALLHSPDPLLVVHCGLLARYGLMSLLTELESSAGRLQHTPCAWLLLPASTPGLPTIDGAPVPLVSNLHRQALELPQSWIENRHRQGSQAAPGRTAARQT